MKSLFKHMEQQGNKRYEKAIKRFLENCHSLGGRQKATSSFFITPTAKRKRTLYEYDGRGLVTKEVNALGAITTYTYHSNLIIPATAPQIDKNSDSVSYTA